MKRKARTRIKAVTLSVGETARRLDISPDSVRNYCGRGWLQCTRGRGNHRRVLLRSIESFEAQRNPKKSDSVAVLQPPQQKHPVPEEFEIYFLGNEHHATPIELGYICNAGFFENLLPGGFNPSTMVGEVGRMFGGGTFKVLRVRDGEVICERVFSLPGPTKNEVAMMREVYMDD